MKGFTLMHQSSSSPRMSSLQPGLGPTNSFNSVDSNRFSRVRRYKASEEEEAAFLAQATAQALVAAKSMLRSGSTPATALMTAKAAAESILLPKNSTGPYLSRRKAKQQVDVVASMALMSAQKEQRTPRDPFNGMVSYDMTEIFSGSNKMPETASFTGSYASRMNPPSVIQRQAQSASSSSDGGISSGVPVGSREASRKDTSNVSGPGEHQDQEEADRDRPLRTESPDSSHVSTSDSEKSKENVKEQVEPKSRENPDEVSSFKRKNRSETVAKLLMPLEEEDIVDHGPGQGPSEGVDESFSSEGSVQNRQVAPPLDPISALFRSFFCAADEDVPPPHRVPSFGVFNRLPKKLPELRDEVDDGIIEKDAQEGNRDPVENGSAVEKSRAQTAAKKIGKSETGSSRKSVSTDNQTSTVTRGTKKNPTMTKHRRQKSDGSMGSIDIIRALESFERERMRNGSPRSQPESRKGRTKESMEMVVLRALAASDAKSQPSPLNRDTYKGPAKPETPVNSPREQGSGAPPKSPNKPGWRRSRKSE